MDCQIFPQTTHAWKGAPSATPGMPRQEPGPAWFIRQTVLYKVGKTAGEHDAAVVQQEGAISRSAGDLPVCRRPGLRGCVARGDDARVLDSPVAGVRAATQGKPACHGAIRRRGTRRAGGSGGAARPRRLRTGLHAGYPGLHGRRPALAATIISAASRGGSAPDRTARPACRMSFPRGSRSEPVAGIGADLQAFPVAAVCPFIAAP